MLSYTWDYTIADIVDSLAEFCTSRMLKPNRTYVWICAFCVNQHRVREARAKNEAARGFNTTLHHQQQEQGAQQSFAAEGARCTCREFWRSTNMVQVTTMLMILLVCMPTESTAACRHALQPSFLPEALGNPEHYSVNSLNRKGGPLPQVCRRVRQSSEGNPPRPGPHGAMA